MPYRVVPIVTDEIYHVFNRGVAKMPIFSSSNHFYRFLDLINYYRFQDTPVSYSQFKEIEKDTRDRILGRLVKDNKKLIQILAFCLMDNHYHFLLKQVVDKGIAKFVSNLQNAYAKYFNVKSERIGPLFQPMFKSVRITTDEQLLHVSRYIHLNPSTGYLVEIKDLEKYPWSSLSSYLEGKAKYSFIDSDLILGLISKRKYKEFVYDQADYQRKLDRIKHLSLE